MDDLSEKLQSLLSDPESMQNLAELAAMLQGNGEEASHADPSQADNTDTVSDNDNCFDFSKLLLLGEIFSQMQEQDSETQLLLALKPYLSEQRSKRVDRAVKLLRLYSVFLSLKEKGLLNDLTDIL